MKKILVFGSNGLLGSSLVPYLTGRKQEVVTAGRSSLLHHVLNTTDVRALTSLLDNTRPDVVINLIAATNVDICEADIPMAMQSNALIPAAISQAIAQSSNSLATHFIHISTDQVYNGEGGHIEDNVSPVNVYGLTKLTGELMISCPRSTVLRTNFYGKSQCASRTSFSDWIYGALLRSENITLFTDVYFSALHVSSICDVIERIYQNEITGTYNLGCKNGISKAEFAVEFAKQLGLPIESARMGRLQEHPLKARRPLNTIMDTNRLEKTLGLKCPDIQDEIIRTAMEYKHA